MLREPTWSASTWPASSSICSGAVISTMKGRPVSRANLVERAAAPSAPRPWKLRGSVRILKTPPRMRRRAVRPGRGARRPAAARATRRRRGRRRRRSAGRRSTVLPTWTGLVMAAASPSVVCGIIQPAILRFSRSLSNAGPRRAASERYNQLLRCDTRSSPMLTPTRVPADRSRTRSRASTAASTRWRIRGRDARRSSRPTSRCRTGRPLVVRRRRDGVPRMRRAGRMERPRSRRRRDPVVPRLARARTKARFASGFRVAARAAGRGHAAQGRAGHGPLRRRCPDERGGAPCSSRCVGRVPTLPPGVLAYGLYLPRRQPGQQGARVPRSARRRSCSST